MNKKIYEDELLDVILLSSALAEGQIAIYPKKIVKHIEQLADNEIEHLFAVANIVSSSVFEAVGAQGTNIVINNGIKGVSLNIVPRKDGDKLNLNWDLKPAKPEELEKTQKKLKEHTDYIGFSFGSKKKRESTNEPKMPLKEHKPEKTHEKIDETKISRENTRSDRQDTPENNHKTDIPEREEEDDYRIRQLFRIP